MKEKILKSVQLVLGCLAFTVLFIGGSIAGSPAAIAGAVAIAISMIGVVGLLEWVNDYYL